MSAAVAAAKKQIVSLVDEIISDAVIDVTDSGSTLCQIEQYDIFVLFSDKVELYDCTFVCLCLSASIS